MSFQRRLAYFMFGVGLGCMLVYLLLIRDREFQGWMPEDRVLQQLAVDSLVVDDLVVLPFYDSLLKERIMESEVLFKESVVRDVPCKEYQLQSEAERMRFQVCKDKISLIQYEGLN